VVVELCEDMEGKGRDVGDCTSIAMRHHGAQCESPLRSEQRRGGGGAEEVPGCCGRAFRLGEVEGAWHRL